MIGIQLRSRNLTTGCSKFTSSVFGVFSAVLACQKVHGSRTIAPRMRRTTRVALVKGGRNRLPLSASAANKRRTGPPISTTTTAKGFKYMARSQSPATKLLTARVPPQNAQGSPVRLWKPQCPGLGTTWGKGQKINHTTRPARQPKNSNFPTLSLWLIGSGGGLGDGETMSNEVQKIFKI